jgi:hypothetical protein
MGPDPTANQLAVTWTVPESAMEDAVRHVRERVDAANVAMAQETVKAEQAQSQAAANDQARKQKIAETQKRLDQI